MSERVGAVLQAIEYQDSTSGDPHVYDITRMFDATSVYPVIVNTPIDGHFSALLR